MGTRTPHEILNDLATALSRDPFIVAIFTRLPQAFQLSSVSESTKGNKGASQDGFTLPDTILQQLSPEGQSLLSLDEEKQPLPEIVQFAKSLSLRELACFPVPNQSEAVALVMIGSRKSSVLTSDSLSPMASTIRLACALLDNSDQAALEEPAPDDIHPPPLLESRDLKADDLSSVYTAVHDQTRRLIGNYSFYISLFDERTQSIRIPYLFEEGERTSIDTFPLGEGLTSIVIRSAQPLLLNKDTEKQAEALGAKIKGRPAKSWLGVPLTLEGRVIGALVVQDLEREGVFNDQDVQAFSNLAHQFASIIQTVQLVDEYRQHLSQVQTAAEIARDISSALNLDELLLKAVDLIRERFNYYHAAIFLMDNDGENVVIREATGEAGIQMKRMGHKLAIGSKSIVGYVASQGEPLIVNDTKKDALYLSNPLLPDTRAEVAIPLKIGERILGVLDVQSGTPFSFGPQEMNTLQILADQVAIAVTNTELFAETQEHLSQHRLLHHITTSAASGTTLDEALNSTVQGLQVTLGGDRVSILLIDDDRKNLITKAWVGYSPEIANKPVPVGTGITGWVAAHQKPLRVNDVSQDARYIEFSPNTKSELALPLLFRNDFLGVLNVESEQLAAYTENDQEMLGTLAGSIAAIVANAKLIEQIRKQVERERQLYEISNKIRRSTNIQSILLTTINELNRVTGAQHTQIKVGIHPNPRDLVTRPLQEP